MNLEREKLKRVDRKLLARLGQDETYQMVRVPVTPATWSTWKRYCETAGVSMGRAIVGLVEQELGLVDEHGLQPASTGDADEQLAAREAELSARETQLDVRSRQTDAEYDRIRAEAERLGTRIVELRSLERNLEIRSRRAAQPPPPVPKVGRNQRCPCGSGRKYNNATANDAGAASPERIATPASPNSGARTVPLGGCHTSPGAARRDK